MTAEELLAAMAEPLPEDDGYCIIDPETRVITIPPEYQLLGVESDEKAERIYFKCPKIVGDDIDLSKLALRVNFRNAGQVVDQYLVDDVAVDGDNITFSWLLSRRVTQYEGTVNFIVCAVKVSGDTITNEWNTTLAQAEVLEGLEAEVVLPEEETDVVNQLLSLAETRLNDVKKATADANTAASNANQKAQEAKNATEDARSVIEQITKDSYLHTTLQSFVDTVKASPTSYGNAIPKKIEGFTRQQTTKGLNLADYTGELRSCSLVSAKDMSFRSNINGQYYSEIVISSFNDYLLSHKGQKLTMSCEGNPSDKQISIIINGTGVSNGYIEQSANGNKVTITISEEIETINDVLLRFNRSTTTFNDTNTVIKHLMLYLGDEETSVNFEPYTGGQPAPNPDYPMEVQGVGYSGFFDGELLLGSWSDSTGNFVPSNNNYVSGKSIIPCKPNDKIVIEYAVQFRAAWIIWCEKDGSFISSQLLQNARKFDATAPANCYGFKFSISETNNTADIESTKHITITINDKYAVCVKAESPNIFNMNGRTAGSAASADIYEDTVKITTLTGSGNAPCVFFYLGPISKFLGKRLYIKADKMESSHSAEGKASCRMVLRAVNGNRSVQSFGIYQNTKAGTWMQSAEIPEDLDVSTVTDLCLQLYIGDGTAQVAVGETATFENVMVCEEKTDEYHPYQSNVTYIPVDYPLFEGDKIIRRNGEYKLVRKWGVQIDDGTHAWKKNSPSDNSDYMYYRNTEPDKDATKLIYCNRLKRVAYAEKSVGISLSSFYPKAIYVRLDADILPINDAGHFNQWLSDHPLTIVYPMETPTEEPLSPEAQKALHSIMATDEQTELTIVGVPADAGIQNQFLLPRNEDGALNTTAYCTAEKNKIVLNELVAQNLDARVNKLEIDNSSLAEQTIVVE